MDEEHKVFSPGLVSVILPVYNHAPYVGTAIRSVLAQDYRPIELIIIDDGSRDGSAEAVKQFLDAQPPIGGIEISFSSRENTGAAETLNEGIRKARGEYLTFLNSDDLYFPSRLQECLEVLKRGNARLIFTYVQPIDATGDDLPYDHPWRQWYYDTLMQELDLAPSISFLLLLRNVAVSTGNLVLHRSVISEIGLFAPYRYVHDLDFLLRYSLREEPIILRKPLYKYRVHQSNTIVENEEARTSEIISAVKAYLASDFSGERRNPVAPSIENWPSSFNDAMHSSLVLRGAIDALLNEPVPRLPATQKLTATEQNRTAPSGREVTIVTHELSRTGAPMLVLELARSLRLLGHTVRVISMKDGPLRDELVANQIATKTLDDNRFARRLRTLGRLIPRVPDLFARVFPGWADRITRFSSTFSIPAKIGKLIVECVDAIILPWLAPNTGGTLVINSFASFPLALQLLPRWQGQAFWYIHETFDPQMLLRTGAARKRFDQLYSTGRVKLLFGSEATRTIWAMYGFDGAVRYWSGLTYSATVSRSGYRSPTNRERNILSVGTSGTRKGTRWLLEAFALARRERWIGEGVKLIIIGCPAPSIYPNARDFLVRIWKPDLRGAVSLLPNIHSDLLDCHYREADLYVQTSVMECLPLTLLKAMTHALPIVSTDADGCREAIQHRENGILVPVRSIEPLARAMADLLHDERKAQTLGSNARETFVQRFSLEATLGPLAEAILDAETARSGVPQAPR